MKTNYTILPASKLFATELGISGVPIPSNGPGKEFPSLKYSLTLIAIGAAIYFAYKMEKKRTLQVLINTPKHEQ